MERKCSDKLSVGLSVYHPGSDVTHFGFGSQSTAVLVLVLDVAWILSSCCSVEMIEDDYTTYYDLLFLIEQGDNTSTSIVLN